MKKIFLCIFLLNTSTTFSQTADSVVIRKIFSQALQHGKAYDRLEELTTKIGPRLSGSPGAEQAVSWAKTILESEKFAAVTLQEVMIPHWVRNDKEQLTLFSKGKKTSLRICSLGGSVPTPAKGIKAKVVEVKSFEELKLLEASQLNGKIIFYNAPLNQQHYHTFHAYGECGKYRWGGAIYAAKYGALAAINRSLTLALDDYPHTGSMGYEEGQPKLPGCAISTKGADLLSKALKENPDAEVELILNCETLPDKLSHNVIAELKGSEFPDEIVLIGGHLDAWDNGQGAHDDGAGCVQSMEVLNIFRELNITPKRTIRVVLFMNEENGAKGAIRYAEVAKEKKEIHIAAIESDMGGATPAGFFSHCQDSAKLVVIDRYKKLFEPYGIYQWNQVGGGVDIDKLKDTGTLLIGLQPDSQRYFDYHHTEIDTFDKIHKRELHLGAAAIASLAYLLTEYGVK